MRENIEAGVKISRNHETSIRPYRIHAIGRERFNAKTLSRKAAKGILPMQIRVTERRMLVGEAISTLALRLCDFAVLSHDIAPF